MSKILITHASFGQGHKKAAEAAASVFNAPTCDILDFTHPLLKKLYVSGYLFITDKTPFIWQAIFNLSKINFIASGVHGLQLFFLAPFLKHLRSQKPQIVISTHFSCPRFMRKLKKELGFKIINIVTDIRVHPLWVYESVDYYFASFEATRKDLIAQGVDPKKIICGYAALREGFLKELNSSELRRKFSLKDRPTILFVSSSRGNFPYLKESINQLLKDYNLIIIYGKNTKLKSYLDSLASPYIRTFSFYEQMWELVSISSVIITKPGGLTVFEGIYKRIAFVFTHYIPGQETENMNIVIKHGLGRFVRGSQELVKAVNYFANKKSFLEKEYPLEIKDIREPLKDLVFDIIDTQHE
tara:strand:+ start:2817 stop:3884 length:1068 start_codon:yes stop_codon:yes gene_type:complete